MEQSYKEKYEQAIERLKQWDREHPCGGYVLSDRDNFIFPELAESEDEKVIKEIIELVMQPIWKTEEEFHRRNVLCAWLKNVPVTIDHEKREGFHLGYKAGLEKQGKQKASYTTIVEIGNGGINALVTLPIEMKTAEESLGIDSDTCNKIVDECIFGEQNPADKIEPKFKVGDKIYLKPEYRMPNDDTPIANTVKEIRRIDDKHYRFNGSYIFIEDQDKYALVEQKPEENKGNIGGISSNSEWSEEDNNILNGITAYLSCTACDIEGFDRWYDWLKSLKDRVHPKQEWSEEEIEPIISDYLCGREHYGGMIGRLCHLKPKQKQTEWSENDKAFLDDILCKLEHDLILNKDEKDWLKSLRPQNRWKPSDEQIKVCKEVYADILSAKGFDLGTVVSELNRLEEGLKKKGE